MELNFEENTVIKELEKAGKYADIMIEETVGTSIRIDNGKVKPVEFLTRGIRIRVVNRGWGIFGVSLNYPNELTNEKIIELIQKEK